MKLSGFAMVIHLKFSLMMCFQSLRHAKYVPQEIWSAACSTGQEPYSISMTAQTYINKNPNDFSDVQIVATDISTAVLDEASQGSYEATCTVPWLKCGA